MREHYYIGSLTKKEAVDLSGGDVEFDADNPPFAIYVGAAGALDVELKDDPAGVETVPMENAFGQFDMSVRKIKASTTTANKIQVFW